MRSINDMTASWLPLPYAKGETAMSKAKTGAWLFCALATLVLSGTPSASRAAPLPLGGIVPLSGATAAARPELAGLVLEDQLIPFSITDSIGNAIYQGTIQNRVVLSNTLGTLAFYFAIRHTDPTLGGSIIAVSRSGFRDGTTLFATDVDFRPDGLGSIGPPGASRNGGGNQIDFAFANNPVTAGAESRFVFVLTDATQWHADPLQRRRLEQRPLNGLRSYWGRRLRLKPNPLSVRRRASGK